MSPALAYTLALLVGAVISVISTLALKRYVEHEERQAKGKVIPGRFPRDGYGGMR